MAFLRETSLTWSAEQNYNHDSKPSIQLLLSGEH